MMIGMMMTKILLIFFSSLTLLALYSTYSGLGLEEIKQKEPNTQHSSRIGSSHSYSNGGWSFGK